MNGETVFWTTFLVIVGAFMCALVARGCTYENNRMNHVAACLEQGREAE